MSSEPRSLDFDILIVGSGIVGSTVACALADRGQGDPQDNALFHPLKIALIDRVPFDKKNLPAQQQPLCFDPRVSAITVASEKLFRDIGVWDQMQKKRISPYREMHVWEQDGTGSIHFSCDDINEPVLGHIIENSVILNALIDRIDTSNNVEIISPRLLPVYSNSKFDLYSIVGINSN